MRQILASLLLSIVVAGFPVAAAVDTLQAGEPPSLSAVAAVAARGTFAAQLWLVEEREFFTAWKTGRRGVSLFPTVPLGDDGASPSCPVRPRDAAAGGKPLFAVVFFAGPGQDEFGLAHVRYDLLVLRPDGGVYARQPGALGVRGWPGLSALVSQLGRDALTILPGRGDPPGFYLVEARVRDEVTGVALPPLRTSFLVR